MAWKLIEGEALQVLRRVREDGCIDAMATDPPAGITFMGKTWDSNKGGRGQWAAAMAEIFAECLRVLKPGAHALVWALPRTSHWTATALEDAGFEVRDVVTHHFGTGFPKSHDVGKAIDKAARAERQAVGPATDAARAWDGWGTALKPASEHWILARKPLEGTVASNVLAHGTGALNVDGCRIGPRDRTDYGLDTAIRSKRATYGEPTRAADFDASKGRWPTNLVLTHALACEQVGTRRVRDCEEEVWACSPGCPVGALDGSCRFFPRFRYQAKAPSRERTEGLPEGDENRHPTVKSIELMRWLCRLVTPPGGKVLDPFAGSGSTGVAALREGLRFTGIEREAEYAEVARQRLALEEGRRCQNLDADLRPAQSARTPDSATGKQPADHAQRLERVACARAAREPSAEDPGEGPRQLDLPLGDGEGAGS